MSLDVAPQAVLPPGALAPEAVAPSGEVTDAAARPALPRRRRLAAAVAGQGLTLSAFLASRLVVLVAGAVGVLRMTSLAPSALTAQRHALGPVGAALAGSVDRFDSGYFLDIAAHGYGTFGTGRVAFYPLYPLLIRALEPAVRSGVIAGVLVSGGCALAALVLLRRLTELELGRAAADTTVLLLAFAPLSFFLTAVYSESLFLLVSVAAMLCARQGRWRAACGLAALATLTRPTGIVLVAGLGVQRWRRRHGPDRSLAWLALAPAALGAYLLFLGVQGYPWLAPFAAESAHWYRITTLPPLELVAAIWHAAQGVSWIAHGGPIYHPTPVGPFPPPTQAIVLLAELGLAVALLVWSRRRLAPEYLAYAAAVVATLLCTAEPGQPLWSDDRYLLTLFPVWMAAGAWLADRPRLRAPVLAAGALLLVFYTLQFARFAFVA